MRITRREMTRTILDSTIQKYISDISSDPDRSIRKLIDLGMNFSIGRFQKKFFNIAQTMLENQKSGYYTLVKNIVEHIDHDTIKKFGINIGYNSCTYGANIIRENEAEFGFNIPWTVIFALPETGCGEYISKTDEYINQGREIGIYTYLIFTESNNALAMGSITECEKIIKKYSDCAFFIFTSPDAADDLYLRILKKYHNAMTVMSTRSTDNFISSAEKMKSEKMLYGAYLIYSDADTAKIISGEWINSISETECPFIFLISDMTVSDESKRQIAEYVRSVRTGHNSPFMIANIEDDLMAIDTIISDDSCSIWFDSEGNGHTLSHSCNMNDFTLMEILKNTMPK